MNILELEIENICECKHAHLKFEGHTEKSSLYLLHCPNKCEVITLALQLICSSKYSRASSLYTIRDKIKKGKVTMQFTLPNFRREDKQKEPAKRVQVLEHSSDSDVPCTSLQAQQRAAKRKQKQVEKEEQHQYIEHSSDSDVPCTSKQALLRAAKRKEKRLAQERQKQLIIIKACRDFVLDPDLITYSLDNGSSIQCSVTIFHVRFFNCTDVIFPRLKNISHGEYCQGKWLDLLSMGYIDKRREENYLLLQFCELYGQRKLLPDHALCKLTTSVLTARNYLNQARLSHLMSIFNDIRWLFEYMTCNEYTVYFLLPSAFGHMQDLTKVTLETINFDLMKTQVQLKTKNAAALDWTRAEKHTQEILLVAVQLSFGYHCQQNIIYLHSLKHLEKHQSFEFFIYSLTQASLPQPLKFEKNYLQRIFNVCSKLNICTVLEYSSSLPFDASQVHIIDCLHLVTPEKWQISVKNKEERQLTDNELANKLVKKLGSPN